MCDAPRAWAFMWVRNALFQMTYARSSRLRKTGRRCDGTFLDLVDTRGAVDRPRARDRDLLPVGARHRVRVWRSRRVARCVVADAAHRRRRAVGDSARCRALLAQAYRRSAGDGAT